LNDQYRLTDKFIAVTAGPFPNIADAEAQKNDADFYRLKELRGAILHGERFSEKELPVHEMAALLRKCVLARIATPNSALNSDTQTSGAPIE